MNLTALNPLKVKTARKFGCHIVTYEWLTDTLQLLDYQNRKAPPGLYHPGVVRDDEAISALFRKREKKARPAKEKALTATESTAVCGEDNARAAEAAENGPERLAISGEGSIQKKPEKKCPPKSSDFEDSKATNIVDGISKHGNSVDNKSDKPAGKLKDGVKVENSEPCIDLSRFTIYRDKCGPYQVEVHSQGYRCVLELFESKSTPKTYLFGIGEYLRPNSSICTRRFPSKTPRDKDHELEKFRSRFWRMSGARWPQQETNASNGAVSVRQPRPVPNTTTSSANYKNNLNEIGELKKESTTSCLAIAHKYRQVDLKTSFKRKSSFPENRPAKELKVTKFSIAGGSGKPKNGEFKIL